MLSFGPNNTVILSLSKNPFQDLSPSANAINKQTLKKGILRQAQNDIVLLSMTLSYLE
jgi:hypothetical protein